MEIKQWLCMIVAVLFIIFVGYFSWKIGRRINYSWSYEDMVKDTVRQMVKEECLK